ncbi:MAG: DJ-1/PfpI family protein, partial [Sulfurimonas sp.]
MQKIRVLVPIAKGFEEIEAVSIVDVLRRAEIEVLLVSLNENFLVEGANGITIQADMDIKEVDTDRLDMIVLPGGWGGTHALAEDV